MMEEITNSEENSGGIIPGQQMADLESQLVVEENTHRALQIEEICEHVFSFLNLEDMKSCRIVNSTWNFVANRFMRRNSQIVFKFRRNNQKNISEIREKMIDISRAYILAERQSERTPFAAFEFQGVIPIELFVTFMRKNSSCVRELKIFGVLKDPKNPMRENYDISALFSSCLRKLDIDWHFPSFKYLITTESIRFIENLKIGNCGLMLDDTRISPIDLCLKESIAFMKNGVLLEDFVLNDVFDLRNTKTIVLENAPATLDLALCVDDNNRTKISRVVKLVDAKVKNWEVCNWKMNVLSLNDIPFTAANQMEIEELRCHEGIIDLSVVHYPKSIRGISLHYETELQCKKSFYFSNMTSLCLNNECLKYLPYFSQHSSIKRIHLISTFDEDDVNQITVNVKDLPEKLETLQLEEVKVEGDEPYSVAELYMSDYDSIAEFQFILNKFNPESVYIINFDILYFNIDEVVEFIKKPKQFEFLTIGKFDWTKNSFKDSKFFDVAEEEAEVYLYRGNLQSEVPELGPGKRFCYCDNIGTPAPPFLLERLLALEQVR